MSSEMEYADLERWHKEWEAIRKQHLTLQQEVQAFATAYTNYSEAAHILDGAAELSSTIAELGESARPLLARLEEWAVSVQADVSTYKRKALERVGEWKDRFAHIKRDVEQSRAQAVGRFNDKQANLREMLIKELHIREEGLFTPIAYNPLDPHGSYERLYEGARQSIQQLADRFKVAADRVEREARQALNSSSLDTLLARDREELRQGFNQILDHVLLSRSSLAPLQDIRAEALQDYTRSNGSNGSEGGAGFGAIVKAVELCYTQSAQAVGQLRMLIDKMGVAALTPEEEHLLALIQKYVASSDTEVDLSSLLAELELEAQRAALWHLLASLYDKRRLQVRLQVMPNR